jgi:TP901 family phage tail tape measure protein
VNGLYRLQVLVDLADRLSGPITRTLGRIQALQRHVALADEAMQRMQAGASIAAVGALLAAPLAGAASEAMKLESAFADVRKVVDFTPQYGPKALLDDLRRLSREIPLSVDQLTQIAAAGGQAGIPLAELSGFVRDVAKTAVAFDIGAGEAGDTLAQLRNVFKLTQPDVMGLADAVNHLSNTTAAKAPDILETLRRVGPVGNQFRMAGQDVAAFSSAMLSTGRAPEIVSTGLTTLINRLGSASIQSKDFQRGLSSIGLSAAEIQTAMQQDATGALLGFMRAVRGAKDMPTTLGLLFGTEYSDDIAALVNVLPDIEKNLGQMANRQGYAGSVAREFASRVATTESKLQLFMNAVKGLGVTVGNALLPPVQRVLEVGAGFLNWVTDLLERFPLLRNVLVGVVIGLSALAFGGGLVVTAFAGIGFASAQARIGMAFLRQTMLDAQRTGRLLSLGLALLRFQLQSLGGPIPALRMGISALTGAVRGFAVALLTNPIFLMTAAVAGLGTAVVWAWNHVDGFRRQVASALAPLVSTLGQLRQAWANFLTSIGPIGAVLEAGLQRAGGGLRWLGGLFAWVLGFIVGIVVIGFARITAVFTQGLAGITNIISGFIDIAVGFFTGDFDRIRSGAARVMQGLSQTLTAPLQLLGPKFLEYGKNLLIGFADGIRSGVKGAVEAVGSVASNVIDRFKNLLGIRSPSRVFAGLGLMLPMGMAQGINAGLPEVAAAVADMAVTPTIQAPVVSPLYKLALDPLEAQGGLSLPAPQQPPSVPAQVSRRGGSTYHITNQFYLSVPRGAEAREFAERVAELSAEKVLLAIEELAIEEGTNG